MVIKLLLVLVNEFRIRVVLIMSPHKEWFFNFEEVGGGAIYMGNGDDMSSIRLRNHDGSTRVLTYIRYVPKLKKNLISLGALESKGLVLII